MKFLIIRFSSIGDIVLTTPVVRCLKKQLPGASIHFLTKKNFGSILESNPYIDQIHFLEDDMDSLINQLRKEKFDFVIDLHNNLRTIRVKQALKIKSYTFEKLNVQKWLMTNIKWNILPNNHIVDRYLKTISHFGVVNDGAGLDYFIPSEKEMVYSELPEIFKQGYVGIVTGAAHATKRIPIHKLSEICKALGLPIVLLGGKEDQKTGELLAGLDPDKILNACGIYSINESACLVKKARVILTPDTGLMHIAAAFHKPIVAVWGNTVPQFGMYPYYGHFPSASINMEVAGLSCRPCSKIGYEACPKKHFKCMEEQDVATIIKKIRSFW
ncbi:MAG: glycosyltransferase family 9 protein [Chitinophagaceae bacterium]